MKKFKVLSLAFFALLLLVPLGAMAFAVKAGNSVYIGKNEVISGNLYAAGSNITVDGIINGDVICAGQAININGKVAGDVICAGQAININGEVSGSVRIAGNSLNINSKVAHNVMTAGASVILGSGAEVGWDMLVAGAFIDMRGKVNGDLTGAGSNFEISGQVGKNIQLMMDDKIKPESKAVVFKNTTGLKINKDATIGGGVTYTGHQEAQIDANAKIKGEVIHNLPKQIAGKGRSGAKIWSGLIGFFAALVIGLVIITIGRKQIIDITDKMQKKIWPAFGWGAIILFIAPIILILLFITLIGIPLALISFALWLIAIYVSKIIVGILIGHQLLAKIMPKQKDSLIWAMIIGVFVLSIFTFLPFVGWLICLLATIFGLGGIALYFKKI